MVIRIMFFSLLVLLFLNQPGQGQTLMEADSLIRLGDFELAGSLYEKLLSESIKKHGECSKSSLTLVSRLSSVLVNSNKLDSALKFTLKFKYCGLYLSNTLGVIHDLNGNPDSAKYYYKQALSLPDSLVNKSTINNNLGALSFSQKSYAESLKYYYEAFRIYKDSARKARTANNIAKSHNKLSESDSALYFYNLSLQLNTKNNVYLNQFHALEALISKAEILPDLKTVLKADSLTKVIQRRITHRSDKLRLNNDLNRIINIVLPVLGNLYQSSENTKVQKRGYFALLFYFAERSKSNILLDEITRKNKVNKDKIKGLEVISLDLLQQSLDSETAVLEYVQGKEKLYSLVITRERLGLQVVVISSKELTKKIMHYRTHMFTFEIKEFIIESHRFYKSLFAPIQKQLENKTRLVILPSIALSKIPFDNFISELPEDKNITLKTFKKLKYLLFEYEAISYHLSSTLAFGANKGLKKLKVGPQSVFTGLACSRFDSTSLDALPYVKKEIEAVSRHFKQGKVYLNEEATKDKLKGLKTDILHIATHGFYNEQQNRFLTGVYLKSGKEVFSAGEVYSTNIQAKVVVLSGCKTGVGKPKKREGVLGFLRAFVYLGTTHIVFTPWSVSDKLTSEFMSVFYKKLAQGQSAREAFYNAKREFFKIRFYPAFWTAYQILAI